MDLFKDKTYQNLIKAFEKVDTVLENCYLPEYDEYMVTVLGNDWEDEDNMNHVFRIKLVGDYFHIRYHYDAWIEHGDLALWDYAPLEYPRDFPNFGVRKTLSVYEMTIVIQDYLLKTKEKWLPMRDFVKKWLHANE